MIGEIVNVFPADPAAHVDPAQRQRGKAFARGTILGLGQPVHHLAVRRRNTLHAAQFDKAFD